MPPVCFVIQPFDDGGEFDKRFDEVIAPAIEAAGFAPYRVDRDPKVVIPIDEIVERIKSSAACVADITRDNPNVWFELGLAIADDKDVALISQERDKYPFDVQHRRIIRYKTSSPGDFRALGEALTSQLTAMLEASHSRQTIADLPTDLASYEGFTAHEIAALALIGTQTLVDGSGPAPGELVREMEGSGHTKLATGLSLRGLTERGLVERREWTDESGDFLGYFYATTSRGADWLMSHQDKLALRFPGPKVNPRLADPGPA
jgi:hypothetical protein